MLAGTPDLPKHLRSLGASFWGRWTQLRIGRITDEAAAAAIRIPLEEAKVDIRDDLLDALVRRCHGYPWFTQVAGDALWKQLSGDAAGPPRSPVTRADVEAVRKRFAGTKDAYYRLRYDEIADAGLLPVARSVADALTAADAGEGRNATLSYEELDAAVERGLGAPTDRKRVLAARSSWTTSASSGRPKVARPGNRESPAC